MRSLDWMTIPPEKMQVDCFCKHQWDDVNLIKLYIPFDTILKSTTSTLPPKRYQRRMMKKWTPMHRRKVMTHKG